ncbi:hypothetical protein LR48_Vigan01g074500 [Vigna angularis]|uniref:Uncharacterized protein n=1 Tax=Phaseolus angularis TaxID=3914 RepID=A0A0L9TKW3_PHAAN|nr:hypothetical protein LR48_Vigan01g074500 [Vigna angularis]
MAPSAPLIRNHLQDPIPVTHYSPPLTRNHSNHTSFSLLVPHLQHLPWPNLTSSTHQPQLKTHHVTLHSFLLPHQIIVTPHDPHFTITTTSHGQHPITSHISSPIPDSTRPNLNIGFPSLNNQPYSVQPYSLTTTITYNHILLYLQKFNSSKDRDPSDSGAGSGGILGCWVVQSRRLPALVAYTGGESGPCKRRRKEDVNVMTIGNPGDDRRR